LFSPLPSRATVQEVRVPFSALSTFWSAALLLLSSG